MKEQELKEQILQLANDNGFLLKIQCLELVETNKETKLIEHISNFINENSKVVKAYFTRNNSYIVISQDNDLYTIERKFLK